jgi:hypothetical protein
MKHCALLIIFSRPSASFVQSKPVSPAFKEWILEGTQAEEKGACL